MSPNKACKQVGLGYQTWLKYKDADATDEVTTTTRTATFQGEGQVDRLVRRIIENEKLGSAEKRTTIKTIYATDLNG